MPDREKVIAQLTADMDIATLTGESLVHIMRETVIDALALLREQSSDKDINAPGKWIRLTGMAPPEYHGHKICSICESIAPYDPLHPWREMLSPYCPGCGAMMEVSGDAR